SLETGRFPSSVPPCRLGDALGKCTARNILFIAALKAMVASAFVLRLGREIQARLVFREVFVDREGFVSSITLSCRSCHDTPPLRENGRVINREKNSEVYQCRM